MAEPHPRQRHARRERFLRWTLTIIASAFLLAWFLGGFGAIAYAWPTGRIGVGPRGFSLFLYELPRTDPVGLFTEWRWSKPQWFHAAWWRSDPSLVAFGCSLFLPGVVLGAFAAGRWYRRWRPFHRAGRRNRAYQFRVSRWAATLATLLFISMATISEWQPLEWTTPWHQLTIMDGRLWLSNEGQPGTPIVGTVVAGLSRVRGSSQYFILYEWLRLGPIVTLEASIWMLTTLAGMVAATLWFIRLRWYPAIGRCANPLCGYPRDGLDDDAPCPECGRASSVPRTSDATPS